MTTTTDVEYDAAKRRISDFLKTYYVDGPDGRKEFVYAHQIAEIAYRRQVAMYIKQEDVHTHDTELADWITENTCRFRKLFYEVVDQLIQDTLGDNEVGKIHFLSIKVHE